MTARIVTGDIELYLAVLDKAWEDPGVQAVTSRLGPPTIKDSWDDTVAVRTIDFTETGVRMQFRSDRLVSVVFTNYDGPSTGTRSEVVTPVLRARRASYPGFDGLVDGVTRESTREGVRELLGPPLRSWYAYDEYLVSERVLSVLFYGSDFREIKLLHEDPIVLNHDTPWAPLGKRRDGRLYLEVPVSFGAADATYEFLVSEEEIAFLGDRANFDMLRKRLDGLTDRAKIERVIHEVCSGGR